MTMFPLHQQVPSGPKIEGLMVFVHLYIEITVSSSGKAEVEAEDFDMSGQPHVALRRARAETVATQPEAEALGRVDNHTRSCLVRDKQFWSTVSTKKPGW